MKLLEALLYIVHATSMLTARMCMKDSTYFCSLCRIAAGESTLAQEGLQFTINGGAA